MYARGLDASSVQGALPVQALVDEGLSFVILKGQQGNDGFDPWFVRNRDAALAGGLLVFAYCFAYPLPSGTTFGRDPKEQAKLAVDRLHAVGYFGPICLDLEWPSPELWPKWGCTATSIATWCQVYCAEVAALIGRAPIIYTYPWWWAALSAADVSWASQYELWLAAYIKGWPMEGSGPRVLKPWATWTFWQFDGDGGLKMPNGVDADFCLFNGDVATLRTWAAPLADKLTPEGLAAYVAREQLTLPFDVVHPAVDLAS